MIALTNFQWTPVKDSGGFIIAYGKSLAYLDAQIADTNAQDCEQGSHKKQNQKQKKMTTNQRILLAAFKVGRSIAIATKTIKGSVRPLTFATL